MNQSIKRLWKHIQTGTQSIVGLVEKVKSQRSMNVISDVPRPDHKPRNLDIVSHSHSSSEGGFNYRNFWIIGIIIVGIGLFLYGIFDWILLVFTGVVIAIAMESLITYLEQKTGRRWLGIALSYLFLVSLLLSGVLVMVPFLITQVSDLVGVVIDGVANFEIALKTTGLQPMIQRLWIYGYLQSFGVDLAEPKYIEQIQSILQNNISAIVSFSSGYAKDAGSIVVNTVGGVLSTLAQIGFVLTLSVLLSIEKTGFVQFVLRVSGNSPRAYEKVTLLYKKLGFWLKTQLLLGLYIGLTMWFALLILSLFGLSIPNKGSLAVISALTELIPYLGPTLGGIPVMIMAAVSHGAIGITVAIILVVCVQRVENNILIPLLFKQNLGVSPVLIFLCMVLGGITVGINGVILAIPIAVIITILVSEEEKVETEQNPEVKGIKMKDNLKQNLPGEPSQKK